MITLLRNYGTEIMDDPNIEKVILTTKIFLNYSIVYKKPNKIGGFISLFIKKLLYCLSKSTPTII